MENTTKTKAKTTDYEAKLKALTEEYEKKLRELTEAGESIPTAKKVTDISRKKNDEYVEVRLFKDGDRYRDDVLAGINGYMIRIKRGVPVKIKRSFAELIAKSEEGAAEVNAEFLMRDGKMERYF
jgi:hypothetical protein